jgi:hypothetical protein
VKRFLRSTWIVLLLIVFACPNALSKASQGGAAPAAKRYTLPIENVNVYNGSGTLTDEHALADSKALKGVFDAADYAGFDTQVEPGVLAGYDELVIEMFSSSDAPMVLGLRIDPPGGSDYAKRFDASLSLRPGDNRISIPLTGLQTNDKKAFIDPATIVRVLVFMGGSRAGTTLYLKGIYAQKRAIPDIPNFYRFDFGTADSPVYPGFIGVNSHTKYDVKVGYGIAPGGWANERDFHHPDALAGDWIGRGKWHFWVDVPNGDYVVWMIAGDIGYWGDAEHFRWRAVELNGKEVLRETHTADDYYKDVYFKHLATEDLPGEDVWKTYIVDKLPERMFTTRVTEGRIDLAITDDNDMENVICALVVFPAADESEGMKYLDSLRAEREAAFKQNYVEMPSRYSGGIDAPSLGRGDAKLYLLPDISGDVYPKSLPPTAYEAEKDTPTVDTIPGGRAFFSAALIAGADGGFIVDADPIRPRMGDATITNGVAVHPLEYKLARGGEGSASYRIAPLLVRNQGDVGLKAGMFRPLLIEVKVPAGTAPGDWTGRLIFHVGSLSLPMHFRVVVHKIVLPESSIPVGLYYYPPDWISWFGDEDGYWARTEAELRDMRDLGFTTLAPAARANGLLLRSSSGRYILDFTDYDKFYKSVRLEGFAGTIIDMTSLDVARRLKDELGVGTPEFDAAVKEIFPAWDKHNREAGIGPIVFSLADEPSNTAGWGIETAKKIAEAVTATGVPANEDLNHEGDESAFPAMKYASVNDGMHITADTLAKAKASGTTLWFYNIGNGRFESGFYLWATQAAGRLQWAYCVPGSDPYYALDGREMDYGAVLPAPGLVHQPWAYRMSEGIFDLRCLDALSARVKPYRGKSLMPKDAYQAMILLDKIKAEISPELRANAGWDWAKMNGYRHQVMELLEGGW